MWGFNSSRLVTDWHFVSVSFLLWLAIHGASLCLEVHCWDERWGKYFVICIERTSRSWPGRTLEETAALFDGEQPQRDLARLGENAAINTGSRGAQLTRRTEKSTDYSPELCLELRPSYASQSLTESQTESSWQSQKSSIAVEPWGTPRCQMHFY